MGLALVDRPFRGELCATEHHQLWDMSGFIVTLFAPSSTEAEVTQAAVLNGGEKPTPYFAWMSDILDVTLALHAS